MVKEETDKSKEDKPEVFTDTTEEENKSDKTDVDNDESKNKAEVSDDNSSDSKPKEAKDDRISTIPGDPRFPHQNQTYHCFISYVDYQRCTRLLGEGEEGCRYLNRAYKTMCPREWHTKWDDQIENGTFPVRLPNYASNEDGGPSESEGGEEGLGPEGDQKGPEGSKPK